MAEPTTDPAHTALLAVLEHSWPGGQHILSHYQDGPYFLVIVEDAEDPHWVAQAVLDAYPPRKVLVCDEQGWDAFKDAYALPQFAADMLSWYSDGENLSVDHELILGPFDQMPGDDQILAAQGALLGFPLAGLGELAAHQRLQDALTAAGNRFGLDTLTAALANMTDALGDPVQLADAVHGLFLTPDAT